MQQIEATATLQDFKSCYMKHQSNCPWLTHARVATMQPVVVLLGNIRLNFYNQEFLKAGVILPYDKHARLMQLVKGTLERLQLGMKTNFISHYCQAPQSCSYFQHSIEGISPQLFPHNLQRNNDNKYQNRQKDNRRH